MTNMETESQKLNGHTIPWNKTRKVEKKVLTRGAKLTEENTEELERMVGRNGSDGNPDRCNRTAQGLEGNPDRIDRTAECLEGNPDRIDNTAECLEGNPDKSNSWNRSIVVGATDRIGSALQTLKNQLISMQKEDVRLLRQLMRIHATISLLNGSRDRYRRSASSSCLLPGEGAGEPEEGQAAGQAGGPWSPIGGGAGGAVVSHGGIRAHTPLRREASEPIRPRLQRSSTADDPSIEEEDIEDLDEIDPLCNSFSSFSTSTEARSWLAGIESPLPLTPCTEPIQPGFPSRIVNGISHGIPEGISLGLSQEFPVEYILLKGKRCSTIAEEHDITYTGSRFSANPAFFTESTELFVQNGLFGENSCLSETCNACSEDDLFEESPQPIEHEETNKSNSQPIADQNTKGTVADWFNSETGLDANKNDTSMTKPNADNSGACNNICGLNAALNGSERSTDYSAVYRNTPERLTEYEVHYETLLKRSITLWKEIQTEREEKGVVDKKKLATLKLFL